MKSLIACVVLVLGIGVLSVCGGCSNTDGQIMLHVKITNTDNEDLVVAYVQVGSNKTIQDSIGVGGMIGHLCFLKYIPDYFMVHYEDGGGEHVFKFKTKGEIPENIENNLTINIFINSDDDSVVVKYMR